MTKNEIGDLVSKETGIDKYTVRKVFNGIIAVIQKQLLFGIDCKIHGLVNFMKIRKEAYSCRNPQTGKQIDLPARYNVKVVVSKNFQKLIKEQKVY